MLEFVRNTPAFRMHLTMFCVIITNVWWDISNSYMARGQFAFFWIFQKKGIDNISSKSQKRQRLVAFILFNTIQYSRTLKNNIYHSNKRVPQPFFYSDTNPVFGHVLIHSFDTTHVLVVTVELTWLFALEYTFFQLCYIAEQSSEEAM